MNLLIDIDGVLAQQVTPVLRALNKKYNLRYTKRHIRHWDEPVGDTNIKIAIESALENPEFVVGMRVIPGARASLQKLSRRHHITIATHRSQISDLHTKEWLTRKRIPFHEYVNTSVVGKDSLQGDILVDDYPGNVIKFATGGRKAILFGQPWNLDDPSVRDAIASGAVVRANSWEDVVRIIGRLSRMSDT